MFPKNILITKLLSNRNNIILNDFPNNISICELREHIVKINGVSDVHHIHVWSMDGYNNYATMHVVMDLSKASSIKKKIREEMMEHGIGHTTIEVEREGECDEHECYIHEHGEHGCHHHHH